MKRTQKVKYCSLIFVTHLTALASLGPSVISAFIPLSGVVGALSRVSIATNSFSTSFSRLGGRWERRAGLAGKHFVSLRYRWDVIRSKYGRVGLTFRPSVGFVPSALGSSDSINAIQSRVAQRRGYVLRNALLDNFVVVRTP